MDRVPSVVLLGRFFLFCFVFLRGLYPIHKIQEADMALSIRGMRDVCTEHLD